MSRREFVAVTAAVGATAFTHTRAFSMQQKPSGNPATTVPKLANREVVRLQTVPFPMKNVRLGEGAFRAAAEANLRYLKTLPTDRLLHTFRLTAGLVVRKNSIQRFFSGM